MQETAEAVQSFVSYADKKVASGSMAKKRLIVPKWKKVKEWAASILKDEDASSENTADLFDSNNVVYVGDGFAAKKDPEHLPATNMIERLGNGLRAVNRFFGSRQSFFGIRVACATMTIGIVNFLEPTQAFFVKQRLVWAMIIVSISMTESESFVTFATIIVMTDNEMQRPDNQSSASFAEWEAHSPPWCSPWSHGTLWTSILRV